jgi:hypothetical protein
VGGREGRKEGSASFSLNVEFELLSICCGTNLYVDVIGTLRGFDTVLPLAVDRQRIAFLVPELAIHDEVEFVSALADERQSIQLPLGVIVRFDANDGLDGGLLDVADEARLLAPCEYGPHDICQLSHDDPDEGSGHAPIWIH